MIFRRKTIHISILIILISFFLSLNIAAEDISRQPRLNVDGITGDDFIGQAGLLYPFKNTEESLWFTDFRYRMSEDDVDEWNLGLGYRKKIDTAENTIAGIYAFKDRREEYDHYWDMWTIGGEILTDQWDFRLNGYITENDKVLAPGSVAGGSTLKVRPEDQVLVYSSGNEVYYKSMNGLDIELGKRFTETDTIFKNVGVYAKLFRFFESNTPTITGRQIRIDKQFGDRDQTIWKIGAQWRDDNVRGSETEATFAISIPFGEGEVDQLKEDMSSKEIVESRMTEKPERDLDVVVGESVSEESSSVEEVPVENPAGGVENVQVWYVTQDGSENPDGSKENPYSISDLVDYGGKEKTPSNFANEGDIIVLSGDITLESHNEEYIVLFPYQQLVSSNLEGHALIENPLNGKIVKFEPEINEATIDYTRNSNYFESIRPAVYLTNNNIVSGIKLHLKSSGGIAIKDMGIAGDYIDINNNIINVTAENPQYVEGISLSGHKEIRIENNNLKVGNSQGVNSYVVGIGIDNSNIKENEIIIKNNTIDGFHLSEAGRASIDSSIFIDESSKDYTKTDDFDNIEIRENEILNTNLGVVINVNYDSYQIFYEELDNIIINYSPYLILKNEFTDNIYDINELRYNGEEINKEDREVVIPSPAR